MIRTPLTLEALALRRLIQERGIQDSQTDLVPKMRKELEDLARLSGAYQIVSIKFEEDKEAKSLTSYPNKCPTIRLGGLVSVSQPTGSSWLMQVCQPGTAGGTCQGNLCRRDGLLPLYDLSLEGETVGKADSVTFFRERFVEDGVLKSVVWVKKELEGKEEWIYRQDSFQLDPRGALTWTCRLHFSELGKTQVFTTQTRRVSLQELLVERLKSFLSALAPSDHALLLRHLRDATIASILACILLCLFVGVAQCFSGVLL